MMSAIDFFLWTVSIMIWVVVILPAGAIMGVALYIVVRDWIETPHNKAAPPQPNLDGARVVFLKPKGPAA